jgi:hypothetical protein
MEPSDNSFAARQRREVPLASPTPHPRQRGPLLASNPETRTASLTVIMMGLAAAVCESIAQAATRFVLSHCTVSLLNEPALGRIIIETRDCGSARHDWKGGYHDRQEHFGQQARRSRHD